MELTTEQFMEKSKKEMATPKVPENLAIDLVERLYGLKVTDIKSLNSFHDQNYYIKVSKDHRNPNIDQVSDQGYTLKIMNTLKSNLEGHFDAIHDAMKHLHQKGLRVPQIIQNIQGKTWQLETLPLLDREGSSPVSLKCGIHLLTYISGVPLATVEINEDVLFQWGALLAKFHRSLEDLESPALMKQPTFLDVKHFGFLRVFLDIMKEGALATEAKSAIENILEKIPSEYEKHIPDVPQGFLHGDFNDQNILVQASELDETDCSVDGILDFDDMHYGSYAWDLGMALGHTLLVQKTMDPLEAVGHTVAGYQSIRELSEKELSFLKISMEYRLCLMSLVSTVVDQHPNNSYIKMLAPLKPKLEMLRRLSEIDNESMLKLYNKYRKIASE